jgi:hypothetical protein
MRMFFRRRPHAKQRQFAPGAYLTDGHGLFRVISVLRSGRSMLASIEDCLTLETREFAAVELEAMSMRLVRRTRLEGLGQPASVLTCPQPRRLQADHDMREVEHDLDRI